MPQNLPCIWFRLARAKHEPDPHFLQLQKHGGYCGVHIILIYAFLRKIFTVCPVSYTHLGFSKVDGIYDISKLLEEYGEELVFYEDSELSPAEAEHWWGEPLYGYYKCADSYIMKKHVELFTAAGIDYIVLDVTNGWTYPVACLLYTSEYKMAS